MPIRKTGGLTRRSVLLGALLPVTGYLQIPLGGDTGPKEVASWLRELLPDAGAAALGAHYLRAFPEEFSASRLTQTLFGCLMGCYRFRWRLV